MKRFRLDVVGALEDRPRLLRAYGRVPGAEVAVVLRPTEHRGMLVALGKDGGAKVWSSELGPAETRGRGRLAVGAATEVHMNGRVVPVQGELPAEAVDGAMVPVAIDAASGRVRVLAAGDAPRLGAVEMECADAVARLRAAQRGLPPKGPQTLKGSWSGSLIWDDGPVIELTRRLASYGALTCRSGREGWSWSFERASRWFGEATVEQGVGLDTLMDAIEGGITAAMMLVKDACGFRDTRRRQAVDAGWAETHPVREPPERPDPTERLAKKGCGCAKGAHPKPAEAPRVQAPPKPTKPKRVASTPRVPRRVAAAAAAAGPDVSTEKDAQLVNLFRDALREAVR